MTFTKKQMDLLISRVEEAVDTKIESKVNGKIKLLDEKLSGYIEVDMQWKKDNEPALNNMKNLTGAWKTVISLGLGLVAISAGLAAFKKLFSA